MIVQRVLHPNSKLAATRLWKNTTLAEEFDVADADVDELYGSLDWLLARQRRIEHQRANNTWPTESMCSTTSPAVRIRGELGC